MGDMPHDGGGSTGSDDGSGSSRSSSDEIRSGWCGIGQGGGMPATDRGTVLPIPMPPGKPDIRHFVLPPTPYFWTNRRGNRLHVRRYLPPAAATRGVVFWMHGYAGHINSTHTVRYPQRLQQSGYAVMAFECEGHGYSPGERCLIRSFDDILDDAVDFIKLVFGSEPSENESHNLGAEADQLAAIRRSKFVLFGESMGGALALLVSLRIQEGGLDSDALAGRFGGAFVSAPALAVSLPSPTVQKLLRNLVVPLVPSWPMPSAVSKNTQNDKAHILKDPELIKLVEADDWGEAKGGLGWHQPMKWGTAGAFSALFSKIDDDMKAMKFPFTVLHDPGDQITRIEGSQRLMELSPSPDKRLVEVPGGLHDLIVNEPDRVHEHALAFFAAHL